VNGILLYLLDANVFIDANRDYYSFDMVPEFWEWLLHMGVNDKIKIPIEIYEDITEGSKKDKLTDWIKQSHARDALILDEAAQVNLVQRVTMEGYASDLTDIEVDMIGSDSFLISYVLAKPGERCVVTTEVSKPSRKRANRHIPDVCRQLGVRSCNTFDLLRTLGFNTRWKSHP